MTRFGVVIAPGRFDATPKQAKAAWDDYRATRGVDIIIGTEYGSGRFDDALSGTGWRYVRDGGDCVIAWRTSVFEPAWRGAGHADRIGTPFYRGGNHHARTPLTSMPLRHIDTGRLVMVRAVHAPAHVQAGDGFRRTTARVIQQAAGWVSSVAVIGKRSRRFRDRNKHAVELVAGDWNVDMHRPHWRGVLRAALGLRCVKPLVRGGDLGNRLISWAFYRHLRVARTHLLPKRDGYDHRPLLITFELKEN